MMVVLILTMSSTAFAVDIVGENGQGARKIQSVTTINVPGNYKYTTDYYSEQAQLMPVQSNVGFAETYGYADKNGNIKIPINKNWTGARRFIDGMALIFDESKNTYSVIDTNGKIIFDFDDGSNKSAGNSYLQVFENDPNGMYSAYAGGNGNSTYKSNLTVTIYDRQGNRTKKALDYDQISKFNNGVAILYKITGTEENAPWLQGGSVWTSYVYTAVATMDTKGVVSDTEPSKDTIDAVNNIGPEPDKSYGFKIEGGVIKNSIGKVIYNYDTSKYDKIKIINEYALLVPVAKEDGTTALTLLDSNGNLYTEYQFGAYNFGGIYGNRFITSPYKTLAEKMAYADTLGADGESWKRNANYAGGDMKDAPISQIQPPTIYEVQAAPNTLNVGTVERLAGDSRYNTAVAISKSGWSHSDNVVLANGNNFPDALVGSSFAYLKDAPILITPSDALDNDIRAEIERLGAKTVYILGNNSSVSKAIENDLIQNYNVIRIGGTEVFDTAVKIGDEIRKTNQFDTVAIATQGNFPDVLAIAPFSAKNTMPILFSEVGRLRTDTKEALQAWGVKNVVIAGGTGVVSSAVENELTSMGITVTRLAGYDRYDTALAIIKHFAPQGGYTSVSIATGENYPDALTGAVLAAKTSTPLVLVEKYGVKSSITDYLNGHTLDKAYIFGGTGVVSDGFIGK